MKNLIALILGLALAAPLAVQAEDLTVLFDKVRNDQRKGPFDGNMFQGSGGRIPFGAKFPPGFQFQAAYRDGRAEQLATEHDFWTANLFTTNYYDLQGDFVYEGAKSHKIDEAALLANAAAAMPRASSIFRHWVIENHFRDRFPESEYAKGWGDRGINTAEEEVHYAKYFFNFYLSSMTLETETNDQLFLPAMLLAVSSPIGDGKELREARELVMQTHLWWQKEYGDTKLVLAMYDIRNAIHNYLSEDIIGMIDRFHAKFPEYEAAGHNRMAKIKKMIQAYYSFSAATVAQKCKDAGLAAPAAAAEAIVANGVSGESLLALTRELIPYRTNIGDMDLVPFDKKAETLVVMARSAQLVAKEVNRMEKIESTAALQALLDVIYIEGFLTHETWDYYAAQMATADIEGARGILTEVVKVTTDEEYSPIVQSFEPALSQWVSVEPTLARGSENGFFDATIKGSSLAAAMKIIEPQ